MSKENWALIPDYPGYEVSDLGRVRSWWSYGRNGYLKPRPHLLKPIPMARGRLHVTIRNQDGQWQVSVHRLVLLVFCGPCPPGKEACHNDGNHKNNRLENLRWDTKKANWADRIKHGVATIGERNNFAKLTEAEVLQVRELCAQNFKTRDIAYKFGISVSGVCRIANGTNWKLTNGPISKVQKGSKVRSRSLPT